MQLPTPLAIHGASFLTLLQLGRFFEAAVLLSVSSGYENPPMILTLCLLVGTAEVLVAMSGIFVMGIIVTVRRPWARSVSLWWNILGIVNACFAIALTSTVKAFFLTIITPLIILVTSHGPILHFATMWLLQRKTAREYFQVS